MRRSVDLGPDQLLAALHPAITEAPHLGSGEMHPSPIVDDRPVGRDESRRVANADVEDDHVGRGDLLGHELDVDQWARPGFSSSPLFGQ